MLAAWGPLAGAAVSFAFVLLGLGLTVAGQGSTEVQTSAFEDSFLVGGLGQSSLPLISNPYANLLDTHLLHGVPDVATALHAESVGAVAYLQRVGSVVSSPCHCGFCVRLPPPPALMSHGTSQFSLHLAYAVAH